MKKILLFLTLLNFVQLGQSVTYLQDSFPVDGSLNTQVPAVGGAWANFSGTLNEMQVTGGKARFVGGATEDLASAFAWPGAGSIFAGFTINVSTAPNLGTGDYFASFRTGATFNGRIFILRPGPAGTFRLGISNNSNAPASTNWLTDLSINQDFRVVVRLTENGANDNITLWVNPLSIADTSVVTAPAPIFANISSFAFRQAANLSGQFGVDNLNIDDSFAAAAGRILAVNNTGNPLASNVAQGGLDRPIYGFQLTANNQNIDFTSANIARTLGNGAQVGDFSNYRLFFDNDNNGFDAGDTLLATVPLDGGVLNFGGIVGQTVAVGTPRRYVVIADVAPGAVVAGTIGLQIANNPDISVNAGTFFITAAPYPGVIVNHTVQLGTPPVISSLNPLDDAVSVSLNANLVIQLSEAVFANAGNVTIVETGVGNFEQISVNDPKISIVGDTVTINPAGTLAFNTAYHVLIDNGAFTDSDNIPFAGINNQTTWNFQTELLALSIDNTGNPLASNLNQSSLNQPIYGFQLTAVNGDVDFTDVAMARVLGNGAQVNNVSNYRLFFDDDNNGFDLGDTLLATVPVDNNTLNFVGIAGQTVAVGVPRNYVVVADVAANAVDNGTISLQVVNNADFTTTANTINSGAPYPNAPIAHTLQDVTPPFVTSLNPTDNSNNVNVGANLVAQFSENVFAGAGNITIVETGVGNFEVIPVGDPKVSIVGNTVTINPAGNLAFNKAYHVLIDNGALVDVGINAFAGINNATTWNFQTELLALSIDNTGNPLASNLNQGATDQPIYGFQLSAGNGNVNFTAVVIARTLGDGALANNVSNYRLFFDNDNNGFDVGDNLLATVPADNAAINFAGIAGQTVAVGVPRNYVVVADVAANAVDNGTISLQAVNNADFTTTANTIISVAPYPNAPVAHTIQDVTAPQITSLNPPDNANNVQGDSNLIAQFDETVAAGVGNITIVETGIGNFEVIPIGDPRVTILGNTVTVNPNGVLAANTAYHVLIGNGALVDVGNNAFAGINNQTTWNFQTLPTQLSIDDTGNPVASNLNQGATDQPIYGFRLSAANGSVTLNSAVITRTLGNGALANNVSNYRLFFDGNNNGFDGTDTLLATVPLDGAALNFAGIAGQTVQVGAPRRYVVVGNVAANAVDNGTISLQMVNNADVGTTASAIVTAAPYPNVPVVHTLQDATAPVITLLNPLDNAVNVAPNANLVAQFSENVSAGAGNITIVRTGVGNFEVIPIGDPKITIVGNTVTIDPAGILAFNTAYHVLIDNGALVDVGLNSFAGINNATTWNFQTELLALTLNNTGNPPGSNLNQGATDQPIYGVQLSAVNGNVNFTGVTINRTLANGALVGSVSNYRLFFDNDDNGFDVGDNLLATVLVDGATINFAGIAGQTVQVGVPRRYVVVGNVAANAVDNGTISLQILNNADVATTANTINSVAPYPNAPIAHTFQDVTAPTIVTFNPPDDAIDVNPNANLVIQLNENVIAGAGNITIVETGVGNFEVIPIGDARVAIVGNAVTINPNGTLNLSTGYHVLIDNGALVDAGNNAFAGINNATTWNFTTTVNTAPTIEGAGIADVVVDENAPPTIINLPPAFQDVETTDADLVYSVTATNFISGDAEIFSSIAVDNAADTLTLSYIPNSNGVYTITVRATDAGILFVEDTFQVTVNALAEPVGSITNIIVTPANGFVFVGKNLQLTATGLATNGTTNVTLSSVWSSGATNIATVDNAGVVTGVSAGDALISAVFDNLTNSVTVRVRKELLITFSKIKPAKRTTKLKVGKGFTVKGKFDAGTNTFTKADITTRPLKIQLAFLSSITNTNGATDVVFQDVTKIKGFKAIKPKSIGKFIAKSVGGNLPAGNATVLLQAILGPEGTNQEVSQIFTNTTPFEVRRK